MCRVEQGLQEEDPHFVGGFLTEEWLGRYGNGFLAGAWVAVFEREVLHDFFGVAGDCGFEWLLDGRVVLVWSFCGALGLRLLAA